MQVEIIDGVVNRTKLTVNKSRITIKLAPEDIGNQEIVDFLIKIGKEVSSDPNSVNTMRGRMDRNGIKLFNDSKSFSTRYYSRKD